MWRKAGGQYPLCNACGVSKRAHGVDRKPPSVLDAALEGQQGLPGLDYAPVMDLPGDESNTLFMPFENQLPQVSSHFPLCQPQGILSKIAK